MDTTAANSMVHITDELQGKYLTFHIAETVYSVPLSNVIEIVGIHTITKVPNLPRYIMGIINLRGKILPVIDVRAKLGLDMIDYDKQTSIIVITINDMLVGFIVDRVFDVVNIANGTLAKPQEFNKGAQNKYLSAVLIFKDRMVLNIDCASFLAENL